MKAEGEKLEGVSVKMKRFKVRGGALHVYDTLSTKFKIPHAHLECKE